MGCSGKKGYPMLYPIVSYAVLAGVVLLAFISPVYLVRYRLIAARLVKSADMMESPVYRAVAERYGTAPNLVAEYMAPEREALAAALTRCDSCGSMEECHDFFDQPEGNVDEARKFCPNAGRFIELAQTQRREMGC
jgi:hypothetical protein